MPSIAMSGWEYWSWEQMPFQRIAVGRPEEAYHANTFKAALAEFISTLIFVFAGEGSVMAFNKLTDYAVDTPTGVIISALAHGFGFFVAVATAANISGGHINPAVTFGAFVGGNITLLRGILYWIGQLLGSTVACLLLKFVTHGMVSNVTPIHFFNITILLSLTNGNLVNSWIHMCKHILVLMALLTI